MMVVSIFLPLVVMSVVLPGLLANAIPDQSVHLMGAKPSIFGSPPAAPAKWCPPCMTVNLSGVCTKKARCKTNTTTTSPTTTTTPSTTTTTQKIPSSTTGVPSRNDSSVPTKPYNTWLNNLTFLGKVITKSKRPSYRPQGYHNDLGS